MKVAVEEIEACKRRLQVEAPEDLVRQAWEEAYGRVGGQVRLPGFRRGRVPRPLVKLHFADEVRREVAQRLIPRVYREALAEAQLFPVEEPALQDVTLEEGAPLRFTAVVEIKPAIALATYTGISVRHAPTPVGDEDVARALEHLAEQHAEFRSVERAADVGDLVIVDYALTPEGMEPVRAEGYAFVVGSQAVLPEIEEAAIGLAAGAERETRVRFPDDHRREELRGKGGMARVRVVEVKEKLVPALDDEFARSLGEYGSVDELRAAVRKELEAQRVEEERRALEDKVVDALLAAHAFDVPEALVLRQIAHRIEQARERVRRQGVDPDQLRWDYDKLAAELRPGAVRAVRRALLLEAIARQEGLEPSEADVEAELERIARARRRPVAAMRALMEKSGDIEALRLSLETARTLDFLIQHARVES